MPRARFFKLSMLRRRSVTSCLSSFGGSSSARANCKGGSFAAGGSAAGVWHNRPIPDPAALIPSNTEHHTAKRDKNMVRSTPLVREATGADSAAADEGSAEPQAKQTVTSASRAGG